MPEEDFIIGKPDVIAVHPGDRTVIIAAKTGRESASRVKVEEGS